MVGSVPVVAVEINGGRANLVVDTGSDVTVLTRVAARRLGVMAGVGRGRVTGAGGLVDVDVARLGALGLGPVQVPGVRALLADAPRPPLDGVLGINVLVGFEVELDGPHGRMALYRARPCPASLPGWAGAVEQLAVQQEAGTGHLFVPVELDGQPLRAMLDTGASRSTLSLQAAGEAGLSGRRLSALPSGRGQVMNAEGVLVRVAPFRSLRVGEAVLERPVLAVVDLPAIAGDMLVGGDFLSTRAVWFQFGLGRAFVMKPDGGGPR